MCDFILQGTHRRRTTVKFKSLSYSICLRLLQEFEPTVFTDEAVRNFTEVELRGMVVLGLQVELDSNSRALAERFVKCQLVAFALSSTMQRLACAHRAVCAVAVPNLAT